MINNQNIGVLSEKVARLESDVKTLALPPVETTDEGKVLVVSDAGTWEAATIDADSIPYSEGVSVGDELNRLNANTVTRDTEVSLDLETVTVTATSDCYVSIVSKNENSLVYLSFADVAMIISLATSATNWSRNAVYVKKGMTFKITGAQAPGTSGSFLGTYIIYPISQS